MLSGFPLTNSPVLQMLRSHPHVRKACHPRYRAHSETGQKSQIMFSKWDSLTNNNFLYKFRWPDKRYFRHFLQWLTPEFELARFGIPANKNLLACSPSQISSGSNISCWKITLDFFMKMLKLLHTSTGILKLFLTWERIEVSFHILRFCTRTTMDPILRWFFFFQNYIFLQIKNKFFRILHQRDCCGFDLF